MVREPRPGAATRPRGHVVTAFDKFRSSAAQSELNGVVARVAAARGLTSDAIGVSDGGEGFSSAFFGDVLTAHTLGPLGEPLCAPITFTDSAEGPIAVIATSDVVGRDLLTEPSGEEALAATSAGVGLLIRHAIGLGARRVIVGCGGSATSDAGRGCYDVLQSAGGLGVPVTVATDVTTTFLGARRYARQKGVRDEDLGLIDARLTAARQLYRDEHGVDVETLARSGAAGGIAGALAALGATLVGGFDEVARAQGLDERLARASLVVTGEGRLDAGSLEGKVVLGVAAHTPTSVPLLVVCGSVDDDGVQSLVSRYPNARVVSLAQRWAQRSLTDTLACVDEIVAETLDALDL